jgi:hypothetical protein
MTKVDKIIEGQHSLIIVSQYRVFVTYGATIVISEHWSLLIGSLPEGVIVPSIISFTHEIT